MFKELLSAAKGNFAAEQRAEEIRDFDIDPEEYVLLRNDKSPMAVELLKAILEKLKISSWEVDERTFRIVRLAESMSNQGEYALALTSDTMRFHLKIYRDFDGEMNEVDLGASLGICAAIRFVEKMIQEGRERKIRIAEIHRLAALEKERLRQEEELAKILEKIEQVNQKYSSIYSKQLAAWKLGEELVISATEYITQKVATLSATQVSLPAGEDAQATKTNFHGSRFKIIDNVACEFLEQSLSLNVSNTFIKNCIDGRNLILPEFVQFTYTHEDRELARTCVKRVQQEDLNAPQAQSEDVQQKVIKGLSNPLSVIDGILTEVALLDTNTHVEKARISVLSLELEGSASADFVETIDNLINEIAENVKLIVWSAKSSTK